MSEPAATNGFRRLPRRAAFVLALLAAPTIIGAVGLALIAVSESLQRSYGYADGVEALMAVGVVTAYSVPFGGPSYLLAGGVLFWLKQRRGATRVVDFVITGFIANFFAALIALPLLGLFGLLAGEGAPMGLAMIGLLIHGFGLIFAPFYGLIFGFVFTRTARDLGAAMPEPEQVAAVFR